MKTRIDINIDRIILHDFPAEQASYIKKAIKTELTRLFSEHEMTALPESISKYQVVSGNKIYMHEGTSNDSIGRQIANSIYKEISR